MIRYINLISFLFSLVLFASCGEDKKEEPGLSSNFVCAPTQLQFKAQGGSAVINVSAPSKPELTIDASWLSQGGLEVTGSKGNIYKFTVNASENSLTSQRSASITVKCGKENALVSVTQEAAPEVPEPPAVEEPMALLHYTAIDIAKDMYTGINIGNTMEVPGGETGWGNPVVNENYIQGLKDAGFNAIRVPCAWDSHVIDKANNTIDPAWIARVKEVVGWIVDRDMYAIVNIHWDGGWLEENVNEASKPTVLPKQRAYWTQIATGLSKFNERLLFAGTNEPYQASQDKLGTETMAVLLEYEQAFIDAVRATGGNNTYRTLIFQGPATNIDKTVELMKTLPSDSSKDRLMAEIHFYDPWNFCGMDKDESWGKMAYFWGEQFFVEGSDRNSTWGDENHLKSQFDKMKTKFIDHGIPVIIGEYGAIVNHSSDLSEELAERHLQSRAYHDECVCRYAKERGLVPFLWDTGEIFNRRTGEVKNQPIVNGIMKGSSEGIYPY